MKKFLSLVLAVVMTMSLVTVSAGAKNFTDNETITYGEAVNVMSEVGVIDGYTDGSFQPTTNLTRGAAAKIICNLILGPTTAAALGADTAPYSDVPVSNVFSGYIAYCQKEGIISGYADGTFKPAAPLTGYAFMKMLLGALGYDSAREGYTGANWSVNVAKQAIAIGLNKGNDKFSGQAYVNREEAMLYAFNTMQATMVEYDQSTSIVVNGNTQVTVQSPAKDKAWGTGTLNDGHIKADGFVQFAEEYFPKLQKKANTDDFMRPAYTWTLDGKEIGTYVNYAQMVAEYTEAVAGKDVYSKLSATTVRDCDVYSYVDGVAGNVSKNDLARSNSENLKDTGNGVLTQVFVDTDAKNIIVVSINTYLAQATANYSESKEYAPLKVFTGANGANATYNVDVADVPAVANVKDGSFYLVSVSKKDVARGEVSTIADAEIMKNSTVTKWSKSGDTVVSKLTTGGTEYKAAAKAFYDDQNLNAYNEGLLTNMTYNVFLDQYGYLIGVELYEGTLKYVFITGYDRNSSNLSIKTATAAGIFLDGTMQEIKVNVQDTNSNIKDAKSAYYTEWDSNGAYALNRWYSYSVNEAGVYTLKPVNMTATYYDANAKLNTSNVTVKANLAGVDTATRVYGEDNSVFITVDTDVVDTTGSRKLAITDVTGVYTGVQNVGLEIDVNAFAYGVEGHVYTVYDKNNYIIGAVALADATGSTANYAYILSGAKSEELKDGTYYWEFEAVVKGEIKTLTAKSKYKSVINELSTGSVQELRFDADGYVVKVVDADPYYNYTYATAQNKDGKDITDFNVYFVESKEYVNDSTLNSAKKDMVLSLKGGTLYVTPDQKDLGLAIAKDAKAVVVQDENGKKAVKTAFDSVSAAISYLADPKPSSSDLEFNGQIIAVLNSNGTAAWVVFNSSTELTTGSNKPTNPNYKTDAEFISLDGTTLTYYLEDPKAADLTKTDLEDIYAMLTAAGYTKISYNANDGWTFTTSKGLTMTTKIETLTRMVKITVDGVAKKVAKDTTVKTATDNSYNDSGDTYINTSNGYVANNSKVVDGTKYYTDKQYVKFTGKALAGTGAAKFDVAYATTTGTALKTGDYVAVGEKVVTTITAKEIIKNPGSTASTKFKVEAAGLTFTYAGELDAKTYFDITSGSVESKIDTKDEAVVIRGDMFTVTEASAVTENSDYESSEITVTLPTT